MRSMCAQLQRVAWMGAWRSPVAAVPLGSGSGESGWCSGDGVTDTAGARCMMYTKVNQLIRTHARIGVNFAAPARQ